MDELVQWLRAQLDEDERIVEVALRYVDADWRWDEEENVALASSLTTSGKQEVAITADRWHRLMIEGPGVVMHVAEHDPARVLREIDAKRRILYLAVQLPKVTSSTDMFDNNRDAWAEVLKQLALPYAARPGYREEWRP
ncbi:DUF6221 family protein [Streptomyces rochei]|uniref:DUF6221 family protein n=1 Tax=Streptomyces rochei TaxID=1928 RepID=UPI0033B379B6